MVTRISPSTTCTEPHAYTGLGYCGRVGNRGSKDFGCNGRSFSTMVPPVQAILADLPPNILPQDATAVIISRSFLNSHHIQYTARLGTIFICTGSIAVACTLMSVHVCRVAISSNLLPSSLRFGLVRHDWTFAWAFIANLISVISLVAGASIWTVLVHSLKSINGARVS